MLMLSSIPKNTLRSFTLVLTLAIIQPSIAQWVQTDGPYGNTKVTAIFANDTMCLASTECGYFSKTEVADRWRINSIRTFSSLVQVGNKLLVGGDFYGLYAVDIENPSTISPSFGNIRALSLTGVGGTLYSGNDQTGFSFSTDTARTWTTHNTGLPTDTLWNPWIGNYYFTRVTSIDFTTDFVFCGTKKGVYRNSILLGQWLPVNNGLPLTEVSLLKVFDDTLFAVYTDNLYISTDFGANWQHQYTAGSEISVLAKSGHQLYMGTKGSGVFVSSNGATSWNEISTGLTDRSVTSLALMGSTLVCGTATQGVFFFQNGNWSHLRQGMVCSSISSISANSNIVVASDRTKVFKLNNSGAWNEVSFPTFPIYPNLSAGINVVKLVNDTIFASYKYSTPNYPYGDAQVVYSTNEGLSWTDISDNIPYVGDDPHRFYVSGQRIYVWEDDRMFFTQNLGQSWTDIRLPGQYCNMFYGFTVYNSIPFAAACGNGQLLRLDENLNWVISNTGLPTDREPLAFVTTDEALFVYMNYRGMYVSFDNGNTWSQANNGLQTSYSVGGFASSGTKLFITTDRGVFATKSYGQFWEPVIQGLINTSVGPVCIKDDTLYVGTYGNGVWKQAVNDIVLSANESITIENIGKVYPNPATGILNVDGYKGFNIALYNLYGQLITQTAIKSHEFSMDISGIQHGIYFVKLSEKRYSEVVKVIVNP